jgi:tRNA pseudouridine65 synthase
MIIYQDEYIVAINKPAGLLVHASLIDKHETQNALQILRNFLDSCLPCSPLR